MHLHIIMHEHFEAPAAIEQWALRNHYPLSYTKCYAGDPFPQTCEFDCLVVMGGPQSPATTTVECSYFDAQLEIAFIRRAIERQKKILGVCLGAQLIGEALGAPFAHSPHREIGLFPLQLTEAGKRDPLCCDFPERFPVGHWHADMPGLTTDAQILATSEGCPRQMVRYAPSIYGFQCHFEFTPAAIEGMIAHSTELQDYGHLPYVHTADQLRMHDYRPSNKLLFQFLDRLTATA